MLDFYDYIYKSSSNFYISPLGLYWYSIGFCFLVQVILPNLVYIVLEGFTTTPLSNYLISLETPLEPFS